MKANKKALALVLCALMLVAASVFGTLAYLTDTDAVTNTFTVGKVDIKLDETDVNIYGVKDGETRVAANKYHLIPGHEYTKDPMVTVLAGSEESYVRMMVEINFSKELDEIFDPNGEELPNGAELISIFKGYEESNWKYVGNIEDTTNNTRTYEFRYVGTANAGVKPGTVKMTRTDDPADTEAIELDPLFDGFTVPTWFNNADLEKLIKLDADGKIIDQFTINVTAHAIQADGFADADAAWAAFAEQLNPEYPAETTDAIDDGDLFEG